MPACVPPKGHALLVPKAPGYATVMDLPPDVAANVLSELPRLARAIQAATGADGINIVQVPPLSMTSTVPILLSLNAEQRRGCRPGGLSCSLPCYSPVW
jgi:hypothetical protein